MQSFIQTNPHLRDIKNAQEAREKHTQRVQRASKFYNGILTTAMGIPVAVAMTMGHKNIQYTNHAKDTAKAEAALALITAKENNGQTHEIVQTKAPYKLNDDTYSKDVIVSIPLAAMKSEQIEKLNTLKQTPPNEYQTFISLELGIATILAIGMTTAIRITDSFDNMLSNFSDTLGKKHVAAVDGIKNMFKSNKQDAALDQSEQNDETPKLTNNSTPNIG